MGIEVIRGGTDAWAERLVAFWTSHGALDAEAASERVVQVVCVVLDGDEIIGACSVYDADVELIGGRRFWVFRAFLLPQAADAYFELVARTFATLDEEFDPEAGGPIGLLTTVPRELAAQRPEAEWADPRMVYAGRADDGAQVRVAYFDGAAIAPAYSPPIVPENWPMAPGAWRTDPNGPPIEVFDEQDEVGPADVVDFWVRESALVLEEAERRVDEVLLVAIEDGRVVGATSIFLRDNQQLGLPMWHARGFVGAAHRRGGMAIRLGVGMREVLDERFAAGRETRAKGVMYEVQSPDLRRVFPWAWWYGPDYAFIGEDESGAHIRVGWLPGATIDP